jgi:hypothetical protein
MPALVAKILSGKWSCPTPWWLVASKRRIEAESKSLKFHEIPNQLKMIGSQAAAVQ